MSNRLQILLNNNEYQLVKKFSKLNGKSISNWVRSLIQQGLSYQKNTQKINAIEILENLELPAPPINQMLQEIEEGRK